MGTENGIARTAAMDLAMIRSSKPLIHNITNLVVMNETANAILALGALPVMAHAEQEVEEMVGLSGALVLNIGTLTSDLVDTMVRAGRAANAAGVPVVLDPVGAGATRMRTEAAERLLSEVDITVVRGNAGEVSVLAHAGGEVRGVESIGAYDAARVAADLARRTGCVVAVTGAVDHVSDGSRAFTVENGHSMLAAITGSGCMASAMIASFLAVQKDPVVAAASGLAAFGVAGEDAAGRSSGPGTFHAALYDALALLDEESLSARARVKAMA